MKTKLANMLGNLLTLASPDVMKELERRQKKIDKHVKYVGAVHRSKAERKKLKEKK